MKYISGILFFFLIIHLSSCSLYEDPEFKKITIHGVPTLSRNNITIKSNAHFYNPNPIGCTLNRVVLEVFVNDKKAGVINQELKRDINGHADFTIPINITFNPAKVINLNYLLKQALSSVLTKTLEVRYVGDLWLSIADHHIVFHLNEIEKVPFKRK